MLEKLEKEKKELLASMEQSLANKFERLYKEEIKESEKLRKENGTLKEDLARAKEDHQFDNLVHAKELKEKNDR